MNPIALIIVAMAAVSAAGCQTPEPESPAAGLTKPVDPPKPPDLGRSPDRREVNLLYNLWLTDPVRAICSGPAPFFEFDSSQTGSQPTMQTLVNCMIDGPLKGKAIRLIGHTDPRGTENYNEKLGLERADRVKRYLVANGVAADRVQTSSVGEEEASASPADWPKDRRVEIQLAQ